MDIYAYIYINTHTQTYIRVYTSVYVHTSILTCVRVSVCPCVCTHTQGCPHTPTPRCVLVLCPGSQGLCAPRVGGCADLGGNICVYEVPRQDTAHAAALGLSLHPEKLWGVVAGAGPTRCQSPLKVPVCHHPPPVRY